MAQRTISKWRFIDQQKLAQRIKAQSLGQYDPPVFSQVRGFGAQDAYGNASRDTAWRQRVANHLKNPAPVTPSGNPAITDDAAQIEFDAMLANEQLENAKRLSGQE